MQTINPNTDLSVGPVLFNWPVETWRDFYFRLADEAPVDTVYVGEVVCSKRLPFFEPLYDTVAERLSRGGKQVIFSTLAEVMLPRERRAVAKLCAIEGFMVEANDASALAFLTDRPHAVGPLFNVYNEETLAFVAGRGAVRVTLPPELPDAAVQFMAGAAADLGVVTEVMIYGRVPLALSARCYHARAHGRVKDNCELVCGQDPEGMPLRTLDDQPFLVVNGTQTLSHACLNLMPEMAALAEAGVDVFRLSPHTHDMVATARLFRGVLDGSLSAEEGTSRLAALGPPGPFCNGFHHQVAGHAWLDPGTASVLDRAP